MHIIDTSSVYYCLRRQSVCVLGGILGQMLLSEMEFVIIFGRGGETD